MHIFRILFPVFGVFSCQYYIAPYRPGVVTTPVWVVLCLHVDENNSRNHALFTKKSWKQQENSVFKEKKCFHVDMAWAVNPFQHHHSEHFCLVTGSKLFLVQLGLRKPNKLSFHLSCTQQIDGAKTCISSGFGVKWVIQPIWQHEVLIIALTENLHEEKTQPHYRAAFSTSSWPTLMQADGCHGQDLFFSYC